MKKPANFLRTCGDLTSLNQRTAISLFSGCGGMDLGMMQAGFEVRVMIDNEKACCDTLELNFASPYGRKHRPKAQKRDPVILCQDICGMESC